MPAGQPADHEEAEHGGRRDVEALPFDQAPVLLRQPGRAHADAVVDDDDPALLAERRGDLDRRARRREVRRVLQQLREQQPQVADETRRRSPRRRLGPSSTARKPSISASADRITSTSGRRVCPT